MASCWIESKKTRIGGADRYVVSFRLGGRESRKTYGGSFKTKKEAEARRAWILEEMAAMRVPDLSMYINRQPDRDKSLKTPFVMCPECEEARMRMDDHVWICPNCDYETSEVGEEDERE